MKRKYIRHFLAILLFFLMFRAIEMSNDLLTAIILGILGISVLTNKDNE
jgi:hypothetical protein